MLRTRETGEKYPRAVVDKVERMGKKKRLFVWFSFVTLLTCASASAQNGQSLGQVGMTAHGAQPRSSLTTEEPANPLLGSPRNYEDNYLSSLGVRSLKGHRSEDDGEIGNEPSTSRSSLNPILGAPDDYGGGHLARSGNGPKVQSREAQVTSYGFTPGEELTSQEFSARSNFSSTNAGPSKTAVELRAASQPRGARKPGALTDSAGLAILQPFDTLGGQTNQNAASAVYRSPW